MDLSTWALLVIALVALVGACLQRVSGMGLGLIGAPVLSLLVGPVAGVLIGLAVTTFMPAHMRVDGKGYAMASGAAGGFMNTLAGIAGPAITVYAQASRWPQKSFAATLQPLFFVAGAVSLAAKEISASEPMVTTAPWYLWPIGLVAMIVGLQLGTRIAKRTDVRKARRIALIIASTGAAVTLVRGLAGMF